MPTLDYEQMHNRSLETGQFTHKIGANVVLFQARGAGALRTVLVQILKIAPLWHILHATHQHRAVCASPIHSS
jgi:hypothetical protein